MISLALCVWRLWGDKTNDNHPGEEGWWLRAGWGWPGTAPHSSPTSHLFLGPAQLWVKGLG